MNPGHYFDSGLVGIAVGVACAGVPTVATTWRAGNQALRIPSEPGFSVGLILIYVPCAYGIGGLAGTLVPSSNSVVNAVVSLIGWLIAHTTYLAGRGSRKTVDAVRSFAGITAIYQPGEMTELKAQMRKDLAGVSRIKLIAPDTSHILEAGHSPIGDVLKESLNRGARLEVLADSNTTASLIRSLPDYCTIVGRDPIDWPPAWLILSFGTVVYFGLHPTNQPPATMPIFRGECSPGDGIVQLADAVQAISAMMFAEAQSDVGFGKIVTASSPKDYRERIVPAEAGARTVDRLPKRLSVMFKSEATVRSIAEQRFGPASSSVVEYVDEHNARRAEFFAALARGMQCREIYNEAELVSYVQSRKHSSSVVLPKGHMMETVLRWRDAIALYKNYVVGITADPLPLKYELVDGNLLVMHEAIGVADGHRLNALFLHSASAGGAFSRDFDTIWDRIPIARRGAPGVLKFIDEILIPIVQE